MNTQNFKINYMTTIRVLNIMKKHLIIYFPVDLETAYYKLVDFLLNDNSMKETYNMSIVALEMCNYLYSNLG